MSSKKYYETDEFLALQREYDAKLAEDGFEDIEYRYNKNGGSDFLAGTNAMYFVRKGELRCQYDEDYYREARSHRWTLREEPRAPLPEIRVWDLHTAGLAVAKISRILDIPPGQVRRIVNGHRDMIRARARGVREDPPLLPRKESDD